MPSGVSTVAWTPASSIGWRTHQPMRFRRKLLRATPSIVAVMTPSGVPVIDPCHSKSTSSLTFSATKRTEKPIVVPVQLIAEEPGLDRAPVAVADRGVETEHDGVRAQPHVAQVAALQNRSQRSRPQVVAWRQRLVLAIPAHRRRKRHRSRSLLAHVTPVSRSQEALLSAALGSITSATLEARSSVACSRPAADRICASIASSATRASRARTASKMGTCSA